MSALIELRLPISGRAATIRRPTGRDMVEAEKLTGEGAGALTVQMALLSRCAAIDGRTLPFEDFQDIDMEDILEMIKRDFPTAGAPGPPDERQTPCSPSQD